MNYAGHLTGGLAVAGTVGLTTFINGGVNPTIAGVCAITAFVMALYPDFDVASTPSKQAFIIGIPAIIILMFLHLIPQAIMLLAFIAVPKMFPHRGFVHTLRFGIMATSLWIIMLSPLSQHISMNYWYMFVSGITGYLVHLILDSHVRL